MERRFHATLKSLLEDAPEDWPRLLRLHEAHVRVIDASTRRTFFPPQEERPVSLIR